MTDFLPALIRTATAADGQPPFSDQSLVDFADGARQLNTVGDGSGAALISRGAEVTEAELVVHPDARHQGYGERLLLDVLAAAATGQLLIWAHGDHPDARALAAKHGLEPVRELLQLRRGGLDTLAGASYSTTGDDSNHVVRAYRAGADDSAWLELNARAFAEHPEQGKFSQQDLDARKGQDWFDADDFLLLWQHETLVGFCWLKVEDEIGEFYAVGVDPDHQGEGIGRVLVQAGLTRLAERGIRESSLYVEADNAAAVRLYRSIGFTDYTIDVQYRKMI